METLLLIYHNKRRNLKVSFYGLFRKHPDYNTVNYIIVYVSFIISKITKLIEGNKNEVRKISINWRVNF